MSDQQNITTRRDFMAAGIGAAAVATLGFGRMAQAQAQTQTPTKTQPQDAAGPVTVVVSFRIKEGKEAEAIALLKELTSKVKENEPGALAYVAHRDAADPMKVTFIEIYRDQNAVAGHRSDPALQSALPKFGEVFEQGAPEVKNLTRVAGFTRES